MEEKNQHSGFYKFFVLSKSVSKQKIMSIEQFLQELLNFKGKNFKNGRKIKILAS